ncbi:MAG: DNA recombination protein RmuC, partial [Candidatus Omnitrophica bacterium]|nr:DNA recombination protein RmuC [Candidatus Omnitrophota bacterium]
MGFTAIISLALFLAAGAALGWTLSAMRTKAELIELKTRIKADESARDDLKKRLSEKEEEVESRRLAAELATREKAVAETRMQEAAKNLDEQKRLLEDARQKLSDTFKALSSDSLKDNSRTFLEQAGKVVEPIRETLSKFEKQVTDIEQARRESYGALKGQLDMFNTLQENLQGETRKLVDALKRPQVRGRWGEITLRRVVETAGMNEYCDFTEQVSVDTDEGRLRPDLIVKLPGGKTVVVDAKVPLKAYMEAIESQDDKVREEAVVKHARQVRDHMKLLGTKQYWNQFDPSPDFVVLFLPGESFFSAALETDRDLIVDGIANKVILA